LKRILAIGSGYSEARLKGLRYLRVPYAHNGAAAAHSLQFGTYALWTAGLLAALAVRPAPSCPISVPRGVNDQVPNDVQARSDYLRMPPIGDGIEPMQPWPTPASRL
jgi:hypothetical protein